MTASRTALSAPVDGFRLCYDVVGDGPDVVLLHGWPGDRADFRSVVPLLEGMRLVVPDLRGFGGSDAHPQPPADAYAAPAQLRSVLGLLDELGVRRAVFGGYDIGSRLLQAITSADPDRVRALVLTPPLPGAGQRLLAPAVQAEFWYQSLHRLPLADDLLDGRPDALRAYLGHLWSHWSGPGFSLTPDELDRLVGLYARPGAFTASIAWYRSRAGSVASATTEAPPPADERVAVPAEVLWPEHDPLFPPEWSDRLGEWYAEARLTILPGCGHFVPLEAPEAFADAVRRALARG
ncbi:MAG TPA: alpha/beta hydrolase [Actinomycetes bacterium]|nr:alpha/beta hydrolase [Actinomycetes bacterium]